MRKNIYTALAALALAAATYLAYSHWQWMQEHSQSIDPSASHEVTPLIIHLLLLLPGVLMLSVLIKHKAISNLLLYGSLLCTAIFATSIYTSLQPGQSSSGGLIMIMGTYPSAIVLSILATQALVEGKKEA